MTNHAAQAYRKWLTQRMDDARDALLNENMDEKATQRLRARHAAWFEALSAFKDTVKLDEEETDE